MTVNHLILRTDYHTENNPEDWYETEAKNVILTCLTSINYIRGLFINFIPGLFINYWDRIN